MEKITKPSFSDALSDQLWLPFQHLTVNIPCLTLPDSAAANFYWATLSLSSAPRIYSKAHQMFTLLVLKLAGAVVAGKWRFSLLSTLLYSSRRVSTEFTALLLFSGDCQFTNFYILKAIYITNQSRRQTNTFKWDTITTIKKGRSASDSVLQLSFKHQWVL